jgi:hypothetical protein
MMEMFSLRGVSIYFNIIYFHILYYFKTQHNVSIKFSFNIIHYRTGWALAFYSGGAQFESQPGQRLSLLKFRIEPQVEQDYFLLNPFQFITDASSYYPKLCSLDTVNVVK